MKKLVTILLLSAAMLLPAAAYCQGVKAVVFPFKNNGQPQQNGLASGLSAMFTTNLMRDKGITVIDPQRVVSALAKVPLSGGAPSLEDAMKIAASLDASYVIMGDFVVFGSKFRIDARVYDVKRSDLIMADKAQAKEDSLFDAVDQLSDKIVYAMTGGLPVVAGRLSVSSDPPGAEVLIDGNKAGNTPVNVNSISTGLHQVEMDMPGFQTYKGSVAVKEGETSKLDVKLIRLYGGVRMWWKELPSSDVMFGGDDIPMSQFQGINIISRFCRNVPAGNYKVVVRMPYKDETTWDSAPIWKTFTADVDITPGEVIDIYLNNDLFSPGLDISTCDSCVANWDFTTKMSWVEMR
ncbi:MAG: PEGA domain-containing protein [Nitrospirota bacterium]